MKRFARTLAAAAVLLLFALPALAQARAITDPDTTPPAQPVKLVFVHHSIGSHWLADLRGGLGIALRDNNYFVSDTNYGWGSVMLPRSRDNKAIGSTTDIGDWWTWFRGPNAPLYTTALYLESGPHYPYSRLPSDPGGPSEIVMLTSGCDNSELAGLPDDIVPALADNPLRGQSYQSGVHTVANAKGVYLGLLRYVAAHREKLFVLIVTPPLPALETPTNARALANWLVDDWLDGYPYDNVFVYDYYTVLTSNGGDPDTSDVGLSTGNHHRLWNGGVQRTTDQGGDVLAYPGLDGDRHPSLAGQQKATAEFVPLLNAAYNAWRSDPAGDRTGPQTHAPHGTSVRRYATATLTYRVDDVSRRALVTIVVRDPGGLTKKTLQPGLVRTGGERHVHFTCTLRRGTYRYAVYAYDLAGNAQTYTGSNRLVVK